MNLNEWLGERKIIVCMGSGGVGKTTMAACLGILAARVGKKTLVLTVDPSRRLAKTLGLSENEHQSEVAKGHFKGALFAGQVDHQKTFENFLRAAADRGVDIEKLTSNRLYQQLSTTLSGSQEFTSLERLYSASQSGLYDLVILDTPPAQHALEFLESPRRLAALFDEQVASWFRQKGTGGWLQNILSTSTRKVFQAMESLTGAEFVGELADFFSAVEKWQGKIQARIEDTQALLNSPQTSFVLVSAFDESKLKEAAKIARDIRVGGYRLEKMIINRSFPEGMSWQRDEAVNDTDLSELDQLRKYYAELSYYFREQDLLIQQFQKQWQGELDLIRIPDKLRDISDLEAIESLAEELLGAQSSQS